MKKVVILSFFLIVATVVCLVADSDPVDLPAEPAPLKSVSTAPVQSRDLNRRLRFSGVLRATDRATLAFTMTGRIQQRNVAIGDCVSKGQQLAELDSSGFANSVATAHSRLDVLITQRAQKQRELERVRRLVNLKAATAEELEKLVMDADALGAAIEGAQTRAREAERQLTETRLRAPFDGVVTAVFKQAGEFAPGGQAVLAISGQDKMELEIEVPESVVTALNSGDHATIELPLAGRRRVAGFVKSVGRSAPGPGRLFPIIIQLDGTGLIPGQTAVLLLDLASPEQLTVPVNAVFNPGGSSPLVFRIREGQARKIPVRVGRLTGEHVSVWGDLVAGDRVVIGGFFGLIDGEKVAVVP